LSEFFELRTQPNKYEVLPRSHAVARLVRARDGLIIAVPKNSAVALHGKGATQQELSF
jgi:hypothetical protein